MTIEQYLTKHLGDRGLWPDEAKNIMDGFKASDLTKSMAGRWTHDEAEYSVVIKVTLTVSLNDVVLAWFDKNNPQHWARGAFVS